MTWWLWAILIATVITIGLITCLAEDDDEDPEDPAARDWGVW
mgnify:CR=1 FL=1